MPLHPARRFGRAPFVAALLALVLAAAPAAAVTGNGRLQIIHLDVGQGDGAVLISPNGQVAMFDNGVSGNPTPASGVKVPQQLQALGITHVDHHFASHYHADHIGLTTTIFGVNGVGGMATLGYGWDRAESYTTSTYTNYVSTLGSKRRTLVKGQIITLDSLSAHPVYIKCVDLAGSGTNPTDENAECLVMKVTYGEFDMLIGGDLTSAIETIVASGVGPVEVYKVHHHGSSGSSNATFLSTIQPKIGVISCGNGNSYGHPTSSALTRLHNAGVKTYWTETGAGVAPNAAWDKVSNNQVIISATWAPGGVDTVRGTGFADTFTNSGTLDVTPPLVAVTSPDGGEDWKAGSSHTITWSASDAAGVASVDVAYSTDGGATYPNILATAIPNSGSLAWSVPNLPGGSARVRVTARDAFGNTGTDASAANFAISTWTIAASAGEHGSLTPSGAIGVVQGTNSAFTIAPDSLYQIADVLVDGVSIGPVTEYAFENVAADHTLAASFSEIPQSTAVPMANEASLYRAAPNPFASSVRFAYRVAEASGRVDIGVYDIAGREVRVLVNEYQSAGTYSASWDGRDAGGSRVHRGVYFIRSFVGGRSRVMRVTYLN